MDLSFFSAGKVFSVSEINNLIKEMLEGNFPAITIEGEISGFKAQSSGHLYFSLKDKESLISAVMFKGNTFSLDFKPSDGKKVLATGRLSVYGPQGKYQLIISKMKQSGEGAILQMIEERKRRLAAEGLFDNSNKRKLPFFPKTIGVVTSPTGAALRDILQITKRRNPKVNVIVLPCLVQGEKAAESIAGQINKANKLNICDVLIVGRGGGSLEDLLPFSEEIVIRSVYESKIPVISAVGHEIDWALIDYASDFRAPTPSAAAEIAIPLLTDINNSIFDSKNELYSSIMQKVEKAKLTVKSFNPENLELKFRSIEQPLLLRLDNAKDALFENIQLRLKDSKNQVCNLKTILQESNPKSIFEKGYSMIIDKKSGKIVKSSEELEIGSEIEIIPAKGKISASVTNLEM